MNVKATVKAQGLPVEGVKGGRWNYYPQAMQQDFQAETYNSNGVQYRKDS